MKNEFILFIASFWIISTYIRIICFTMRWNYKNKSIFNKIV